MINNLTYLQKTTDSIFNPISGGILNDPQESEGDIHRHQAQVILGLIHVGE